MKNIPFQDYMAEKLDVDNSRALHPPYKQFRTTMAGLLSSVVAGCAFGDHDVETPSSGTSLVSETALPVPALIPAWCLRWLLLPPLRRRLYSREAWRSSSTEPLWPGCGAALLPGVPSGTTAPR